MARETRRDVLEYLVRNQFSFSQALSKVVGNLPLPQVTDQLTQICGEHFKCSCEYVSPEGAREYFADKKKISSSLREKSYFQLKDNIYVPLVNNGYHNLGFLCLEGVSQRFLGLNDPSKDQVLRYLGSHGGQIVSQTKAREEAEMKANYDDKTGLFKATYFLETILAQMFQQAKKKEQPITILFTDLDYFGGYNDNFGHLQGDIALKEHAKVISNSLEREGDVAARYGGEEFIIALPNTDYEGGMLVAERIRSETESLTLNTECSLHISNPQKPYHLAPEKIQCSIGLASYPIHGQTLIQLTVAADNAMLKAKEKGRNTVEVYGRS